MPDIDQRVTDGLRQVATRAPVDADVWSATHEHVAKRRQRRRTLAGATLVIALLAGGLVTGAAVRGSDSKAVVSTPTPTTRPSAKTLAPAGPIDGNLPTISAAPTGGLTFAPAAVTVRTGVYSLVFRDGANEQHTLAFDDPATLWSTLTLNTFGEVRGSRIFFGRAGSYVFYCAVPGHRAAGMKGIVTVTGPTVTLAQAEASATQWNYG